MTWTQVYSPVNGSLLGSACLVGLLVLLQAYVFPGMVPAMPGVP